MPTPTSTRRAPLLLGVALVLSACSATSGDGSSSVPTTTPTRSGASLLADLALVDADLVDGEQRIVPADGDTVDGTWTMRFCAFDMPSEALRTDRHHEQIVTADFTPVAAVEAVRYGNDGAIAAMNEIRGAFIDCPEDEVIDTGYEPPATYGAFPIDEAELSGLVSDHVGADITTETADGGATETVMIFQRRGDVIIATTGADRDRVIALANAAGTRLAAAQAGDVGD